MPVSHDAKPRNAHRHASIAKRTKGTSLSARSSVRRRLRSRYAVSCLIETITRRILAHEGKNWRWFELASAGRLQQSDAEAAGSVVRLARKFVEDQLKEMSAA